MIPILFDKLETSFASNGLGRLTDAIRCTVEEQRNGLYELEMEYPIDGQHYGDIAEGRIIYSRHSDALDAQPFRIYRITRPLNGIITINAAHISYDLNKIVCSPFTASSLAEVFVRIHNYAINDCPFDFWTDKAVAGTYTVAVPTAIRAMLGGTQGSILDVYGTGEYEFDNFTVKLHLHRGTDNGVTIRYGKNLTELEQVREQDTVTGVAPYWAKDGEVVVLPEGALTTGAGYEVPYTNNLLVPYTDGSEEYNGVIETAELVPLDLSNEWQEAPTVDQLRAAASSWLASHAKTAPDENLTISFVQLWQTNEFKDVAPLQRVSLCDTVTIQYAKLGISAKAKVIRTVYDALLERYDEVELGEPKSTLSSTISNTIDTISSIQKDLEEVPSMSAVENAVNHATQLITGGLGGHVVIGTNANGQPNEILIMDTDSINTAVNVIRMNGNGIGFSTTGYNGPYTSAWTIDGQFVADFITAGTLTANIIKAGILADEAGVNYWNMLTGDASFAGMVSFVDLLTSGESVINGDNITTGKIQSANGRVYFDLANNVIACNKIISTFLRSDASYTAADITSVAGPGTTVYYGMSIYNTDYTDGTLRLEPGTSDSGVDSLSFIRSAKGLRVKADTVYAREMYFNARGETSGTTLADYLSMRMTDSTGYQNVIEIAESSAQTGGAGGRIAMQAKRQITMAGNDSTNGVYVVGSFTVNGTKSRAVETEDYGERHLYSYETPAPLFGDVGEGEIGEDGSCYVWIDPILAETISTSQYQVFLQPYGSGTAYVSERSSGAFKVEGTPGLAFGWELKARQADFNQLRFEKSVATALPGNTADYAADAVTYLQELYEGRIAS